MPVNEIIAGAVLGFLIQTLHDTIQRAKDRSATTKCILERLDSTLYKVTPLVVKVENLMRKESDEGTKKIMEDLKNLLEKADVLVNAYVDLKRRKIIDKYRYKRRIKELEGSLKWMVDVDVQVNQWADMKEIMAKMSEMNTKLDEITRQPIHCLKAHDEDHDNTHNIAEGIDPSLEAKSGCSSNGCKPKIDIHFQWKKKHDKEGGFRFVFK